ncbi:MAG: S49 family peptidase [Deltaproteobacteria bacterium]|nr:S49 family peptidase [Deltaproteobacteria bacterium]
MAASALATSVVSGEEPALYVPFQTVANPDAALSVHGNPAGWATTAGTDLRAALNLGGAAVGADRVGDHNRAVGFGGYAAVPLSALALGGGVESVDAGRSGPAVRSHLGAALDLGETVAVGAVAKWSMRETLETLRSWDAGLLIRPARWVSVGAALRNLGDDASRRNGFETRFAAGLAMRPWLGSDRVTASAEVQMPLDEARIASLAATLAVQVARGFDLVVEHVRFAGDVDGDTHRTALGVQVGLGRFGIAAAGHADRAAGASAAPGAALTLRMSTDAPPSVIDEGDPAVFVALQGELVERRGAQGTHLGALLLRLDRIARRPGTRVVVLQTENLSLDWAQVEELRGAIADLRKAGKKVLWYADHLGTRNFGAAVACDQVWLSPGGTLQVHGVGADFVSLAEALTRVGVEVQVVRYRAHKSAGEAFDHAQPSPELADTLQRSVERRWRDLGAWVQAGRDVSPTQLEAALLQGAVYPDDAKAAGLVDAVVPTREMDETLRKMGWLAPGQRVVAESTTPQRSRRWGPVPEIAVVEIDGAIADHRESTGVLGRTLGGAAIAKVVERAQKDGDVKAIVARIASPGGSVYGSEVMREALAEAARVKPTVASMGGVAASGGYWTSLGADTVLADRGTVTGSIGILSVRPNTQNLYDRLGLRTTRFGAGPGAGVMSTNRPLSPEELALVDRQLGRFYGLFLDRTAQRRKLDRDAVDALAGGRIWFGDEAVAKGLVDRSGGLLDALALARVRAGLQEDEPRIRFLPAPTLAQQLKAAVGLASADDGQRQWTEMLVRAAGPWLDAAAVALAVAESAPLAVGVLAAHPRTP